MSDELQPRLQQQLGTAFALEREIEGGGMSRVFVARDNALERTVAIKVLRPTLAATMSVDRFRREIMVAAGLQHPNLVPVLSAGDVDGLPYFIMPFVKGESLRVRLRRGPLSVRETVGVMRDVARGLAFAHDRGIVHRDIKPDNILLAGGTATVTDFGVAKAITLARVGDDEPSSGTTTEIGVSLGTPAYMAPEQAAADPRTDHRADLYALGIVAYEMLVGVPPFHGRPPQAVLAAHFSEPPPPITARRYDVPQALVDVISACLSKDPSLRPRHASAIARTLDDPAVTSGPAAAPSLAAAARLRRRAPAIGAAALAAVILAAIIWGAADADDASAPLTATADRPGRSVAILPLRASPGDRQAAEFVAGLLGELTVSLGRVPGIRMPLRHPADQITDSAGTTGSGADAVDIVVDGVVQRERDRLRVNVRLVSVAADSTMWGGTFEGSADDLFGLQRSVADALVAALQRASAPGSPAPDRP